jgi:chemotaxis methyl-accepting protein methylase
MAEKLRPLGKSEIDGLAKWLTEEMGIDLSFYRTEFVARRFLSRALAFGFKSLEPYLDFIESNEKEKRLARKRLLVPTTEFFRNQDVFKALSDCLKCSSSYKEWKEMTFLSAPCSTGEEALSLAIFCDRMSFNAKIIALDRNISSLRQAMNARYNKKALLKLDKFEIKRYFREEGSYRTLEDRVLKKVFPLCCDLRFQMPLKIAHVVFMRNFFIYLTEESQRGIIDNVKKVLIDGGLLVLGKVERLAINSDEWEAVDIESKIYRFKRG